MFRLIYSATAAGAPNQYGEAVDTLGAENGAMLQSFPKTRPGAAAPSAELASSIDAWLSGREKPGDPVILMIHGYLFDPSVKDAEDGSPFNSVYGLPPSVDHRMSWLPLARECDNTGKRLANNAIAFAYKSQAGFFEYFNACRSNSYQ